MSTKTPKLARLALALSIEDLSLLIGAESRFTVRQWETGQLAIPRRFEERLATLTARGIKYGPICGRQTIELDTLDVDHNGNRGRFPGRGVFKRGAM